MTEELKLSIANLYDTFSTYPLKGTIDGCPCCVSGADKLNLHSKPLKELVEEDLNTYVFKAITTWGDVDDFKHFLPRILELLATDELVIDIFTVSGKLIYGKWEGWKDEEKDSIRNFFIALWTDVIRNTDDPDRTFADISGLFCDVTPLLNVWEINFSDNSFKNLIEFIYWEVQTLNTERKLFSEKVDEEAMSKINTWLLKHSDKIEQGFFNFEKSDPGFSERISICLDIVKGLKPA